MDVNDPGGYDKRLPRQERLLEEADIDERDREKIEEWKIHRKANVDNDPVTLAAHLKHLRLSAERASVALVDMEQTDYDRFIVEELEENRGLTQNTINNYRKALKQFLTWLGRHWAENIEFVNPDRSPPPPEKLLSMKEINSMLQYGDVRGKAGLALYADTGWRLTAITSLTQKLVDLDGDIAKIYINEEAHVKGAEGGTPLSFSRGYVARLLDQNPWPDDPEAPIFFKTEQIDGPDDRALGNGRLRQMIYDMAEQAEIDRDRINVHLFRHSAVKRLKRQGVRREIAEKRFKWVEGSEMWEWYGDETEEEEIEDQAVELGLIDREDLDDDDAVPEETTRDCPVCGTELPGPAEYCHRCGQPLTAKAAEETIQRDRQDPEETAEDLAEFDGVLEEMDTAAAIELLLRKNPELLEELDISVGGGGDDATS